MKKQPVAESRDYSANGVIIIGQGAITQSRRTARREYTDEKNNNITETQERRCDVIITLTGLQLTIANDHSLGSR